MGSRPKVGVGIFIRQHNDFTRTEPTIEPLGWSTRMGPKPGVSGVLRYIRGLEWFWSNNLCEVIFQNFKCNGLQTAISGILAQGPWPWLQGPGSL